MIKKALVVAVLLVAAVVGYRWMNAPIETAGSEQRRGNAAMQMRSGVTGQGWRRNSVSQATIQVEAIDARQKSQSPSLPLLGTVNAKRQETITATHQARVADIHVRAGDRVEAGQPLIALESDALVWTLRQQEATVRQQQAAIRIARRQHEANLEKLDEARANHEREVNLRRQGYSNDSSVQAAAEALRNAQLQVGIYEDEAVQRQAQLEQVMIQLEQVQSDLDNLTPTAPFNAEVISIATAKAVRVAAGASLLTLVDRDSLFARTQIPLSVYRQVRDASVEAYVRINGERYPAPVASLAATSSTGSVAMELSLPPDLPVLINETLELELSLPPVQAFAIPQNAVYYGDQIYRIVDGRLAAVTVDILGYQQRAGRQWALVNSEELEATTRVLTTRLSQPTNGTPVTVVNGVDEPVDAPASEGDA